jgi:hypothetical protein
LDDVGNKSSTHSIQSVFDSGKLDTKEDNRTESKEVLEFVVRTDKEVVKATADEVLNIGEGPTKEKESLVSITVKEEQHKQHPHEVVKQEPVEAPKPKIQAVERPSTPLDKEVDPVAAQQATIAVQAYLQQIREDFEKQLKLHEEVIVQRVAKMLERQNQRPGIRNR